MHAAAERRRVYLRRYHTTAEGFLQTHPDVRDPTRRKRLLFQDGLDQPARRLSIANLV